MEYTLDERALLVIDSLDGLEYKHKASIQKLYQRVGDIFAYYEPAIGYISKNVGEKEAVAVKSMLNAQGKKYADFIVDKLNSRGVKAITNISEGYPNYLKNYPYFPIVIYAKGNEKLLFAKKKIAIVGSRKTLPFVLKRTEDISSRLSESGVVIVTGSATGGDRSALLGAKDSGNIISVLAHGHDYIYPQSNRTLIDKIAENGLVISEYPPETTSAPWRFPMRNRLIAALAGSVLISSGELTSGTRYTAKFAEAYSKPIYAFPYSICEKSGAICNELIKMGKAQLIENAEDIAFVEDIDLHSAENYDFDESEREILLAMDGETQIDDICEKTGKASYEVMATLSMLEIKGVVVRGAQNSYTSLIKLNEENPLG